jgi:hypothetical protein
MSRTFTTFDISTEDFRAVELDPIAPHDARSIQRKPETRALQDAHASTESLTNDDIPPLSRWRATVIVGTVACITLINSMLAGILVVSLPTMSRDLGLKNALLLWPASVSALACAFSS